MIKKGNEVIRYFTFNDIRCHQLPLYYLAHRKKFQLASRMKQQKVIFIAVMSHDFIEIVEIILK